MVIVAKKNILRPALGIEIGAPQQEGDACIYEDGTIYIPSYFFEGDSVMVTILKTKSFMNCFIEFSKIDRKTSSNGK